MRRKLLRLCGSLKKAAVRFLRGADPGFLRKPRRKARRFLLPVEDERFGNNTSGGLFTLGSRTQLAAGFPQRKHLRSFSDSHIVRQATAKGESAQKAHPTHTFALRFLQLASETGRLIGGRDLLKVLQFVAHAQKGFAAAYRRSGFQMCIEQSRLSGAEADAIGSRIAHGSHYAEALQPFLRQQAK